MAKKPKIIALRRIKAGFLRRVARDGSPPRVFFVVLRGTSRGLLELRGLLEPCGLLELPTWLFLGPVSLLAGARWRIPKTEIIVD